jgi:hypothetical protein
MSHEEEGRQKGFKVEDRRRFSETGEPRSEAADAGVKGDEARAARSSGEPSPSPSAELGVGPSPAPITFATFVLSLSTQALAQLGDIPDPIDRSTRVDLEAAREIIDILGMLREKTHGNLGPDESAQLDEALYALRMRYVDRVQQR